MPFVDPFGPSGQGKTKLTDQRVGKVLRDLIASGNVKATRRTARNIGLSDRDIKAVAWIARGQKPHGFLDRLTTDVTGSVTGLAKGIPRLAYAAGKEATALPRVAIKAALGKKISRDEAISAIPIGGMSYGIVKGAIEGREDPDFPLSSGIGASFRRTGERAADPKRAIKEYSKHPFSTLVEDVGNVAIVGGVAAKTARFAGAPTAAARLERLAASGYKVANAPFLPVSMTARGANVMLKKLG